MDKCKTKRYSAGIAACVNCLNIIALPEKRRFFLESYYTLFYKNMKRGVFIWERK